MNSTSNNATAQLVSPHAPTAAVPNGEPITGDRSTHYLAIPDPSVTLTPTASPSDRSSRQAHRNLVKLKAVAGANRVSIANSVCRHILNTAPTDTQRVTSRKTKAAHANTHTVRDAKAGEPDRRRRFDELVTVHLDDLYRFAHWLSGAPSVTDDVVQETLIRAWKSMDRLNDLKAAKSWLLTIVRRETARHFGRQPQQSADVETDKLVAERTDYDTSTEAFVLRRALNQLPPEYREPLLMQVVYGYSQKEIAEHLGISNAGAGTRLFRAKEKMRDLL